MNFSEKWQAAQQENNSRLAIGITPRLIEMPAPIMRYDDPFLPFGRTIIENTQDFVCAYVFDLASYLTLGAAGARALERTIPIVPPDIPKILHGPFVTADYVKMAEAFGVDAVTLATDNPDVIQPYIENERYGIFVKLSPSLPAERESGSEVKSSNLGRYNEQSFELGGIRVLWIKDEIIYASRQMNFEEKVRAAAEHYRKLSHE